MTFLLNQPYIRKVKKPLAEPLKHVSFLAFIQVERNQLLTSHEKYQEIQRQYESLQQPTNGNLAERIAYKKNKIALEKQLHTVPLSPRDFDRNIVPFLDLYYTKDRNAEVTDESLIDLYKQEFVTATAPKLHTINTDNCNQCGTEYVFSSEDAMMYCQECGNTSQFMDATSNSIAYGDEIEYTSFSYKRINHLNEWLNHFQAKETTPVPDDVLSCVMTYLFEKRCTNTHMITFGHIKKALKTLSLRKYYDQSMQILCRLTGRKPLRLDPITEEKIRLMFIRIQKPFEKYCPKNRKTFLSYPYCMYKFCQLLDRQDLLPYFSLLKGKDKLLILEETFELICKEVGWKFIPIHLD
jgi:hypothetical protein